MLVLTWAAGGAAGVAHCELDPSDPPLSDRSPLLLMYARSFGRSTAGASPSAGMLCAREEEMTGDTDVSKGRERRECVCVCVCVCVYGSLRCEWNITNKHEKV